MTDKARFVDYFNLGNLTNPMWCDRHKPSHKFLMGIVALIVLMMMLGSAGFVEPATPTQAMSAAPAPRASEDRWTTLDDREKQFWAREIVKVELRDPDSAKFRGLFVKDKDTVCGEINAKNGLGGYSGWQPFVVGNRGRIVMIDQPCR